MSTNCIRVVEYRTRQGEWVRCNKTNDNFHGFDTWRNKDYSDRGFPQGCTVDKSEYTDMLDGMKRDLSWGKSYITLEELEKWIEKEFKAAGDFLYREMANTQFGYIIKKLEGKEPVAEGEIISDEEFKETFEECLDWFSGLESEYTAAYTAAQMKYKDNNDGDAYRLPLDRVRIVYWFE